MTNIVDKKIKSSFNSLMAATESDASPLPKTVRMAGIIDRVVEAGYKRAINWLENSKVA